MLITALTTWNDGLEQFKQGLVYEVKDDYGRVLVLSGLAAPAANYSKFAVPSSGKVTGTAPIAPQAILPTTENVVGLVNSANAGGWFADGTELYFSQLEYDQAPSTGRTLASQAVLAALGITNAQAVSNLPMQGYRKDGTFGYLDHNLCYYSENFSQWSGNSRKTRKQGTTRWVVAKTLGSSGEVASVSVGTSHALGPKVSALLKVRAGSATTCSFGIYNDTDGGWNTATSTVVLSGSGTLSTVNNNLTLVSGLSTTEDTVVAILGIAVPASKAMLLMLHPGGSTSTTIGDSVEVTYAAAFYGSSVLDYVPNHTGAAVFGPPLRYERGEVSNYIKDSGDLTQAFWTRSAQTSVTPGFVRSNGVTMSLVSGITQSSVVYCSTAGLPLATNGRCEVGAWIEKVSESGRLRLCNTVSTASGSWEIDFSMLPAGVPVWITRNHPAVTIVAEFKSHNGSATGAGIYLDQSVAGTSNPLSFYFAGLIDTGATAPAAYLATEATAPLHTAGTPKRQNLLKYSNDFTNAEWAKNTGGSISSNAIKDPLGGTTASAYIWAASTSSWGFLSAETGVGGASSQTGYTYSIWLKGSPSSVGKSLRLDISDVASSTGSSSNITLTDTWTRYSYFRMSSVETGRVGVSFHAASAAPGVTSVAAGDEIYIWRAQLTEGNALLDYVDTTNVAISEYPLGALVPSPAITNLILDSNDLTTANWTLRGSTTRTAATDAEVGAYTQIRALGAFGANDIYQGTAFGIGNNAAFEPAILLRRVSTSGTVVMDSTYGGVYGEWLINLARVRPGWNRIDRNHPAVTITTEFTTQGAGNGGIHFNASSGSLDFDVTQINAQAGRYCGPLVATAGAQRSLTSPVIVGANLPSVWNPNAYTISVAFTPFLATAVTDSEIVLAKAPASAQILYRNAGDSNFFAYDGTNVLNPVGSTSAYKKQVFAMSRGAVLQSAVKDGQTAISSANWSRAQITGPWEFGSNNYSGASALKGEILYFRVGSRWADATELMRIANNLI